LSRERFVRSTENEADHIDEFDRYPTVPVSRSWTMVFT